MAAFSDTELLNALESLVMGGGRIVIERMTVRGDNPGDYEDGYRISGAGLGGGFHATLRDALTDHFTCIIRLVEHDEWFARYAESITPHLEGI